MKRLMLFAVLSALVPTPVLAVTAHLGGSYLITETHFCSATATIQGYITQTGDIHQMIGAVTVTPSPPDGTSGTFTFSVVNNDGAIVIMNGEGAFASKASTGPGVYSFSGTTFTMTPKGESAMTYTQTHGSEPVCPIAQSEGHDFPGLIDEFVPGVAAMVDNVLVGFEDPV